ncbi:MAG: helix-turn-helix domain-containing protein [Gemmatimonadaceae bacterium]
MPSRRKSAIYEGAYQLLIKRVREARLEAGLTQSKVAAALGRPLSFVSKCELGERRIDPIDLEKFADLYGKPFEYFFAKRKSAGRSKRGSSRRR